MAKPVKQIMKVDYFDHVHKVVFLLDKFGVFRTFGCINGFDPIKQC